MTTNTTAEGRLAKLGIRRPDGPARTDFGVLTGAVKVDMKRVEARKDAVSGGSRKKTTMPDVTCSHMRAITTVKHAERYAVLPGRSELSSTEHWKHTSYLS